MTDEQYIENLLRLASSLERAAKARPYDPEAYNEIVNKLNSLEVTKRQRRRRRPWAAFASCIILLIILVWIVYQVLLVLYSGGTQ